MRGTGAYVAWKAQRQVLKILIFFSYLKKNIDVFLALNIKPAWLNNIDGVQLFSFYLLLIGQQGLRDFDRTLILTSIGWKDLQIVRQLRGYFKIIVLLRN